MSDRPTFSELYRARQAATQGKRDERQAKIDAKSAELREAFAAPPQTPEQIEAGQARQAKQDERQAKIDAKKAEFRAGVAESRNTTFRTHGRALGVTSNDSARLLVAGAQAAVETGADVRSRVTVTRLVALGVFALAARKRAGHVYITFTAPGEGVIHMVPVPVKHEAKARAWAAEFNRRNIEHAA
jgi:hypothetical protein